MAATGEVREGLVLQIGYLAEQVSFWKGFLADLVARGECVVWGPDTVGVGDHVRVGGSWFAVVRVNRKSVSVSTGFSWTRTVPYRSVTDCRPAVVDPELEV